MNKPDIKNREDIFRMVSVFYSKVSQHELLGPIFNSSISDWNAHLKHLTTFWESSLFMDTKYLGNPLDVHVKIDKVNENSITQEHFGQWLNLWVATIDEHFEGEVANRAKTRARKMASFIYIAIFQARQELKDKA
ncbi:group III truncated hemoglobin [Mangrovimonas aestuarii]|uniref:group III truncated hemoglobin n=1 Tax=Mangrovimonas aestuarii TaxID=3018443 RepID=UPI002379BA2A|nr:group III truncated hemoglobin [Mangrovimonas aestuarii]